MTSYKDVSLWSLELAKKDSRMYWLYLVKAIVYALLYIADVIEKK